MIFVIGSCVYHLYFTSQITNKYRIVMWSPPPEFFKINKKTSSRVFYMNFKKTSSRVFYMNFKKKPPPEWWERCRGGRSALCWKISGRQVSSWQWVSTNIDTLYFLSFLVFLLLVCFRIQFCCVFVSVFYFIFSFSSCES